jgi:hypothetical protein
MIDDTAMNSPGFHFWKKITWFATDDADRKSHFREYFKMFSQSQISPSGASLVEKAKHFSVFHNKFYYW